VCPMCAPTVQPGRACCCNLHVNHATRAPDQIDAMPSQRDAQLDHDVDYQTAYQSARTIALNGGLGLPIASLRAGQSHRPTVDGMKEPECRTWAQSGPNARDRASQNACLIGGGYFIHARFRPTYGSPIWGSRVASSNLASPTDVCPCQRHSARLDQAHVSRSQPVVCALFVHCACNPFCDPVHGLLTDAFEHVRVDVSSHRDRGVPAQLGHDADVSSLGQHQAGVIVPQAVESPFRKWLTLPADLLEQPRYVGRIERPSVFDGEDVPVTNPRLLGRLTLPALP
jgi:hypothetical protein